MQGKLGRTAIDIELPGPELRLFFRLFMAGFRPVCLLAKLRVFWRWAVYSAAGMAVMPMLFSAFLLAVCLIEQHQLIMEAFRREFLMYLVSVGTPVACGLASFPLFLPVFACFLLHVLLFGLNCVALYSWSALPRAGNGRLQATICKAPAETETMEGNCEGKCTKVHLCHVTPLGTCAAYVGRLCGATRGEYARPLPMSGIVLWFKHLEESEAFLRLCEESGIAISRSLACPLCAPSLAQYAQVRLRKGESASLHAEQPSPGNVLVLRALDSAAQEFVMRIDRWLSATHTPSTDHFQPRITRYVWLASLCVWAFLSMLLSLLVLIGLGELEPVGQLFQRVSVSWPVEAARVFLGLADASVLISSITGLLTFLALLAALISCQLLLVFFPLVYYGYVILGAVAIRFFGESGAQHV